MNMKKFKELEKIVKKHFPDARWEEERLSWFAETKPNSKDKWEQPETLVAFDKEASKKFYSYMSTNGWDSEGNIEIGVRKNIFESYLKQIPTFEDFVNESYKRPSPTTKIAGEYRVTWGRYPSLDAMVSVAGFERENDDSDSLYLMDDDDYKPLIGSLIVKNKDMSKLEKGIEVKAKTTIGDHDAIIRRIGDL